MSVSTRSVEGIVYIGQKEGCLRYVAEKYGSCDQFTTLDKVTYLREFLRWLRLAHDPPAVAVVELPPRAVQVQLLKAVEELKCSIVVFWTSAINAVLPTLAGRCRVVRGEESATAEVKLVEKLLSANYNDPGILVTLYREAGDIDVHELRAAIKASQLTVSGDRALSLLNMHDVARKTKSAKEFVIQWIWGRS